MRKVIILAAGRGERMRPLTDVTPKPLLPVAGQSFLAHHLQALRAAGVREVVINISYLAEKIRHTIGDGAQFGLSIHYSHEPEALETGGGILQALPLLGAEPFLVIGGDLWTAYPWQQLIQHDLQDNLAHLVMVKNPDYHPAGDYYLDPHHKLHLDGPAKFTYASFGVYHPALFDNYQPGKFRLPEVLINPMQQQKVTGELYQGRWENVGTVAEWERLQNASSVRCGE